MEVSHFQLKAQTFADEINFIKKTIYLLSQILVQTLELEKYLLYRRRKVKILQSYWNGISFYKVVDNFGETAEHPIGTLVS